MKIFRAMSVMAIALLASSVMLAPLSARADGDHRHDRSQPHWQAHEHEHEGDHVHRSDRGAWDHDRFHHFSDDDWNLWHRGRWVRGHDGDELGWWWVAAGICYFYPHRVVYPSPYTSATVVVNNPPHTPSSSDPTASPGAPAQYWYYCRASKSYYPYVKSCAGKWEKVPSTPPPPPN